MSADHKPRRGEVVWDETRKPDDRYGKIIYIDYESQEAVVMFSGQRVSYDIDFLMGNFVESSNQWQLRE